jgi:2-hydroxychromene-2-carboxylate isomerase
MTKQVEFFFDVGSPASYLAFTQLATLKADILYKPMLLGGVFQATGNASPVSVPAKGRYTFVDFARHAQKYGVELNHNPHFPINTLQLMRTLAGFQLFEPAQFLFEAQKIFNAIWVESLNLNDPVIVAPFLKYNEEAAVKDALKATTQEAVARGVFGAPTFFVGEAMFFGQDRLDFVREALNMKGA